MTSTRPTAGAAAWSLTNIEPTNTGPSISANLVTGITCVTGPLCIAVDAQGRVITSTDPTGGASAWTGAVVTSSGLSAVSCPSASSRVAVGGSAVASSANPTGGAAAWHTMSLGGEVALSGISCPSVALCVAIGQKTGTEGVARKAALAALSNVVHACSLQRFVTILQRGDCPASLTSPGVGLITITWLDSHGTSIALGTAKATTRGPITVHIRLTNAGKRELGNTFQEVSVRVVASFQDVPGHLYSRSGSIALLP